MKKESINITESWTFQSQDVASHFDYHVREQLPWYDTLTSMVSVISRHFLPYNAVAYDIGASTGNLGNNLRDIIEARSVNWIGIDNAEIMRQYYRAPGELIIADAIDYDYYPFDFAICFLSMMFMSVELRKSWLMDEMIPKMKAGGAMIIIDKQEPVGGVISTALQRVIWQMKMNSGALPEEVVKKELSLSGIQRPLPLDFFDGTNAKEFFRFGNFAGWIIEKGE